MATVSYGALSLSPSPLVGINIQSKFFGADIRYALAKTYTLAGTILSNITSGISGLHTQQESIITGFATDYLPFSIDGKIIGYPKVGNVSFDVGTWVQKQNYTIDLEFLESGNPFQVTGDYYNLTGISGLFHNIENLNETLEYNTDFKTYGYTHNIEIQYRTGVDIDPFLNSKIIASGLLNNTGFFPFAISGGVSGVTTYEERENVFDGVYGVTKRFEGTTGTGTYDHLYSLNLRLEENGNITTTQNGRIRGLGTDKYGAAKNGYNIVKNGIYESCSGFYGIYSQDGVLSSTYIADHRADDTNKGEINYARTFTNESGISNVRWRYSHEVTRDENDFTASERGNINGMGHASVRFDQASGEWLAIESGIRNRVLSEFSGFGGTGNMYLVSKEKGFNRFNGSINYSYMWSNAVGIGAGSGIQSYETVVDDQLPMSKRVYISAATVGVLAQSLNRTTQGSRTVSVHVQSFRETDYPTRFDFCKHKINENRPLDSAMLDPFLNSLSIDYTPAEGIIDARAEYLWGGYKTDLSLYI